MDSNLLKESLQQETSALEPMETCTSKVRKESTISHYEVFENGETWWETLFYTQNWGTLKSAVQRYCGFNCSPYKESLIELESKLRQIGIKANLSENNYNLILKISKRDVRVDYAFKNRGRSIASEESADPMGSGTD